MNKVAIKKSESEHKRPMPRAKRREQLLEVAQSIIQENGIGGLTMSALAEKSGASKPIVYEHFDNAESVAIALIDKYFETMIDMVAERVSGAETLEQYLSAAIDTKFEFHRNDKLVVRSITNGHASGERLNAAYRAVGESAMETFEELVRQQGVLPARAPIVGRFLWETTSYMVFEYAGSDGEEEARTTLKAMIMGALHAIIPGQGVKPVTPEKILAKSRAMKQSRGD